MSEPRIHEREGWRWINRCPLCGAEAIQEDDWPQWICEGEHRHLFDQPKQEILERPS